ncbi:MAG: hypothetical protein NTX53_09085 [candidate division WOR-3 bacterium]|nr:hypothetical protein [candidate division WOR-3 bacterium]
MKKLLRLATMVAVASANAGDATCYRAEYMLFTLGRRIPVRARR